MPSFLQSTYYFHSLAIMSRNLPSIILVVHICFQLYLHKSAICPTEDVFVDSDFFQQWISPTLNFSNSGFLHECIFLWTNLLKSIYSTTYLSNTTFICPHRICPRPLLPKTAFVQLHSNHNRSFICSKQTCDRGRHSRVGGKHLNRFCPSHVSFRVIVLAAKIFTTSSQA